MILFVLLFMASSRIVLFQAREKGRPGCGFVLLLLPLFIGGVVGGVNGAVLVTVLTGAKGLEDLAVFAGGLAGGGFATALVLVLIRKLPVPRPRGDDSDDRW